MWLHESWHRWIWEAYIYSVWEPLENWITTYRSNDFTSGAEAEAKAAADINAAFAEANSFRNDFLNHKDLGHPDPSVSTTQIDLQAIGADWGSVAFDTVAAYMPDFKKLPGNCPTGEE